MAAWLQATPELLAKLKAFPGVRAVNLTLERQALVTAGNQTRGALLRGVRPEDLQSRDMVSRNIVHGDLGAFGTRPGVVIGERLRQALNVRAGDKITLVTHRVNENGTIAPRYSDYEVLASFLTRRYEFDNGLVFVPLPMLQDDLEYGNEAVSSIDLDIADPAAAPRLAEELRKSLGRDDLRVAHWLGLNARFVGALQVERVMMFIILTLIVRGRGDERGGELHHAGARQARQHRHPAHHGGGAAAPSCAPSSCRRPRSAWSAPPSAPASACWSAPTCRASPGCSCC